MNPSERSSIDEATTMTGGPTRGKDTMGARAAGPAGDFPDPASDSRRTNGHRRVYCLVPPELAASLHDVLRRHFRDDSTVEVVVEGRAAERRSMGDRRVGSDADPPTAREGAGADGPPPGTSERRRIRGRAGRRVAERRVLAVRVDAPELPRRVRRHADRIAFVERLEPASQELEDADTARLVARFQAGDRATFSTLYARYFDRVYAYMRVVLKDNHEAEDATQEVFVSLLQSLPTYERRRQPFRAWLFTVVRNRAVDALRKTGKLEVEDAQVIDRRREERAKAAGRPDDEPSPVDWITDRDLLLFVERLPLAQRQVLVLRYILELTHAEVATALGRSEVDVRTLQSRALRYLRDRLSVVRAPKPEHRSRMRVYRRQMYVLRMRRFSLSP